MLYADFKKARNPRFHRKYFALLNLGFKYWEPVGGTSSPEEKSLVCGYVQYLAHFAGSEDALQSAADEYLVGLSKNRAHNITATKSFDAFRRWVTVEARHYDTYEMPNGSLYMFCGSRLASDIDLLVCERFNVLNHIIWAKPSGP